MWVCAVADVCLFKVVVFFNEVKNFVCDLWSVVWSRVSSVLLIIHAMGNEICCHHLSTPGTQLPLGDKKLAPTRITFPAAGNLVLTQSNDVGTNNSVNLWINMEAPCLWTYVWPYVWPVKVIQRQFPYGNVVKVVQIARLLIRQKVI